MKSRLFSLMLICCVAVTAYAQTPVEKQALEQAAKEMRSNGDKLFIVAHLMADGLIKEKEPYSWLSSGDTFLVNDKPIAAAFYEKYHALAKDYSANYLLRNYFGLSSNIVPTIAEILDTASSFRTSTRRSIEADTMRQRMKRCNKQILKELAADKLIQKGDHFTLLFRTYGIFLNKTEIDKTLQSKYWAIVKREEGFDITTYTGQPEIMSFTTTY